MHSRQPSRYAPAAARHAAAAGKIERIDDVDDQQGRLGLRHLRTLRHRDASVDEHTPYQVDVLCTSHVYGRSWSTIPWTEPCVARRANRSTTTASASLRSCPIISASRCFPGLLFALARASFFRWTCSSMKSWGRWARCCRRKSCGRIQDQMQRLSRAERMRPADLGVLGARLVSSSALVAIVTAITRAYDLPKTRPWWRVR